MPASARVAESSHHNRQNDDDLQNREEQLELSGALHANPIDERDEHNGGDGQKLSVGDREWPADEGVAKKGERGKRAKDAHNAGGDRRQCSGHRDGEVRPAIQEATKGAVGVANINVFAAGLRLHRAEFCVRQSAAYREQATNDPGSKHEIG